MTEPEGPTRRRSESTQAMNATIGRFLMTRRQALGLTRTDLESMTGLPRGAVRRIEDGSRSVSAGELYLLIQILDLDVSSVFQGISETEPAAVSPDEQEIEKLLKHFFRIDDAGMRKRLLQVIQSAAEVTARKR